MDSNNQQQVRERIRIGEYEIEVEGSPDYVRRRINEFLSGTVRGTNVEEAISTERLRLDGGNGSSAAPIKPGEGNGQVLDVSRREFNPADLVGFFLEKSPQNQGDIVLVVTYFYQKYLNRETLTLENYQEGFKALKRAAVKEPSNYKSSVRNVADRTEPKLLFNPERGKFALTVQGEQYVENMEHNPKEESNE